MSWAVLLDAGARDDRIQVAEAPERFFDHVVARRSIAHVHLDRDRIADLRRRALGGCGVDVGADHAVAAFRQDARGRGADARPSPRDDRDRHRFPL